MKKVSRRLAWMVLTCFFAFNWFVVFSLNAYAYIDPSAVTYVIQAVAGVIIAIGACLTIFRHKIFAFFKKGKGEETKQEIHFTEEDDASDDSSTEDKE